MKTILITNYWTPYNNAGTIRWWNFAEYINFDVLTVKKPKGLYDETLEDRGNNVKRIRTFSRISSFNGICLSVRALFTKADTYIFTTPSETLLIGAYLLQKMGKKVMVDVRDKIDRPHQPIKLLIPLYKWLYKRIKNITVAWEIIDKTKVLIHHGHDNLKLKIHEQYPMPKGRFTHKEYNELLQRGYIPARKVKGYPQSSFINLEFLWGGTFYQDWRYQAILMKKYLRSI